MDRKILLSEGFSVNPIAPLTKVNCQGKKERKVPMGNGSKEIGRKE